MATAAIFGTSVSVVEVVPQQLSYVVMLPRRVDGVQQYPPLPSDTAAACYSALEEFCVYYPFFLDMGPVSLCRLYRFCGHLNALLAAQPRRHVYLVSGAHMQRRANSVYLIAAHGLLYRGLAAVEALAPFKGLSPPLAAWHDASPQADPFHLTTLDVLRGIARARASGFFSFSCFDLARFERYEAAENGDLNWLAEGRFLALAGPQDPQPGAPASEEGYSVTSVEQLLPVLKQFGVGALVRLNRKYYNERKVVAAGIAHADLYFEDGSNPPEHILQKFLKFCEGTQGAIGVRECVAVGAGLASSSKEACQGCAAQGQPSVPRPPLTPHTPYPHFFPPPRRLQGRPGAHRHLHWRLLYEALQFHSQGGHWVDEGVPPRQRHWAAAGLPRVHTDQDVG